MNSEQSKTVKDLLSISIDVHLGVFIFSIESSVGNSSNGFFLSNKMLCGEDLDPVPQIKEQEIRLYG